MADKFCMVRLDELLQLFHLREYFMVTLCVLHLVFSLVATLGNLLVIRALWKASLLPVHLKRLFLSLAFSDLAVGILPQLMFGVIVVVMLKMTSAENYDFNPFCPTILTVCYFFMLLLASASLMNQAAIAVDRLLAVSLHLRYQELVTKKRLFIALVSLWLTSGVAASIFILLSKDYKLLQGVLDFIGLLPTTVAYIRVYKVVRNHHRQIRGQIQLHDAQTKELFRQKKSAYNAMLVYVVFLACYLPVFVSAAVPKTNRLQLSFLLAHHATEFLVLLNSSLNPLVYCWRYREIRENVKATLKKILRLNENENGNRNTPTMIY